MDRLRGERHNEGEEHQAKRVLDGHVDGFLDWRLRGWAYETTNPRRNVEVFVFIDGQAAGGCIANGFRADLRDLGYGDGAHGFSFEIPLQFLNGEVHRFDVIDLVSRLPLPNSPQTFKLPLLSANCGAEFVSERQLGGWLSEAHGENGIRTVQLLEDGIVVSEAKADLPSPIGPSGAYRLELPQEIVDGRAHNFVIQLKDNGVVIEHFSCVTPNAAASKDRREYVEGAEWAKDIPARRHAAALAQVSPVTVAENARRSMENQLQTIPENEVEERYRLIIDIAGSFQRDGRISEAAEYYSSAIALDSEKADAFAALAKMFAFGGREAEAEEVVAQGLRHLSENAELNAFHRQLAARHRPKKADMIAFFLPQFHITPENNEWWGRGFTEWTNVGKSQPLFDGHIQPRRPTTLGYYDLRLPETANAQFEMARRYGISAFCYYYYWFEGRRVLSQPLQDLLDGRTGPFPFCICWANEDWTRSWDGLSGEVLLAQNHSPESDRRFLEELLPVLQHPEYYRHDGKPVILIYRINKLSEPQKTVAEWRRMCRDAGVGEIYLCAVQSFGLDDPREFGCDAAVEFPPHCTHWKYPQLTFHSKVVDLPNLVDGFTGSVFDYRSFAKAAADRPVENYPLHRTCFLAWDNTPRRDKSAHVFHHYSVEAYRRWLTTIAAKDSEEHETGLVFINAWNEWAEGTTLEPDDRFGFENLEATRSIQKMIPYAASSVYWLQGEPQFPADRLELDHRVILIGHDAHQNGAQINLLNMARCLKRELGVEVVIVLLEGGALLSKYETVGRTVVIGKEEGWERALTSLAEHYAAQGTRKAICNTAVTGSAVAALRKAGYKVVSLVHELPSVIETHGLQTQCWEIADHSDYIAFASQIVADNFVERFWPSFNKIAVTPQGVIRNPHHARRSDMRAEIRAAHGFPEDALVVMGCGYGDTRKGIDLFVQMAAEVRRLSTERLVCFVWVGDIEAGIEPYVRTDIHRLGLEYDLVITGYTDDPARFYIAADVFALTSREDPFPSVVMEAFEAAVPVVAFDQGGGYVDIVNERTGGLVPYLDVRTMARKIHDLISNEEDRNRIGQHCHEFCRDRFSYAPYMRKLMALLDGVPREDVMRGSLQRRAWMGDAPAPSISVIVPNYNYGRYLELRLRTILDQTLTPVEIIVLDDASTDYSLEVIEAVGQTTSIPITVVRNEKNTGNPFVQWARGLEMVRGDLVWIAEADDYCEPILLERLAREMVDETVVMSWCDSIAVDEQGRSQGFQYKSYHATLQDERWHNSFRTSGKRLNEESLFHNNVVPNASAVLFRRSAAPKDMTVIQDYKFSGDWWFWIDVAEAGNVAYVADPLNYHRRHAKSVMGEVLRNKANLLAETIDFYQRLTRNRPSRITGAVTLNILHRLDSLYRGAPDLVAVASAIGDHPDLGNQYWSLVAELNPGQAAVQISQRQPAALVLSAEALKDEATVRGVLGTLRRTHRLHLVLIGDGSAAKVAAIDQPGLYESVTWIAPDMDRRTREFRGLPSVGGHSARNVAENDLVCELGAILRQQTLQHLYANGLLALKVIADVGPVGGIGWQVVVGPEFECLLGNLTPSCSFEHLQRAVQGCYELLYLGGRVPHAAAQLARAHKVLMRPMNTATYIPKEIHRKSNAVPKVRYFVAMGPSAALETWVSFSNTLASFSNPDEKLVLRLLSWGDNLRKLRKEFSENTNIEILSIYNYDMDLESIGEIGVDFSDLDLNDVRRAWFRFLRAGMKVIIQSVTGEEGDLYENERVVLLKGPSEHLNAVQKCLSQ